MATPSTPEMSRITHCRQIEDLLPTLIESDDPSIPHQTSYHRTTLYQVIPTQTTLHQTKQTIHHQAVILLQTTLGQAR